MIGTVIYNNNNNLVNEKRINQNRILYNYKGV